MIGLEKGKVKVIDYQKEWSLFFLEEKAFITKNIDHLDFNVDIQHIGSTAVPDLQAKPIIDIGIGVVAKDEIIKCAKVLAQVGYIDRGHTGGEGGYLLVKESAPLVRTHHIHISQRSDLQWRNDLKFRDALIASADIRNQYANLKIKLQTIFSNDRKSYTAAKDEFIQKVLKNKSY